MLVHLISICTHIDRLRHLSHHHIICTNYHSSEGREKAGHGQQEEGSGERARVEKNNEYEREGGRGGKLELKKLRSRSLEWEIKL